MVNINKFLSRWANLRHAADIKKAKLDKALRLQQFHADIHETKVGFAIYFEILTKNVQQRASLLGVFPYGFGSCQLIVEVWRDCLHFSLGECRVILIIKPLQCPSCNQSKVSGSLNSHGVAMAPKGQSEQTCYIYFSSQKERVNST